MRVAILRIKERSANKDNRAFSGFQETLSQSMVSIAEKVIVGSSTAARAAPLTGRGPAYRFT